jgi:hypothetical protein
MATEEIEFKFPGGVDTNAFILTMLYVILHKLGGDVTITEAEYNAAFAGPPLAITMADSPKGTVRMKLGAPHAGPVCADRGDGRPVCFDQPEGQRASTTTLNHRLVTCPVCVMLITPNQG